MSIIEFVENQLSVMYQGCVNESFYRIDEDNVAICNVKSVGANGEVAYEGSVFGVNLKKVMRSVAGSHRIEVAVKNVDVDKIFAVMAAHVRRKNPCFDDFTLKSLVKNTFDYECLTVSRMPFPGITKVKCLDLDLICSYTKSFYDCIEIQDEFSSTFSSVVPPLQSGDIYFTLTYVNESGETRFYEKGVDMYPCSRAKSARK